MLSGLFALVALVIVLAVPVAMVLIALQLAFNLLYLAPVSLLYVAVDALFGWQNFIRDSGCSLKYLTILIS